MAPQQPFHRELYGGSPATGLRGRAAAAALALLLSFGCATPRAAKSTAMAPSVAPEPETAETHKTAAGGSPAIPADVRLTVARNLPKLRAEDSRPAAEQSLKALGAAATPLLLPHLRSESRDLRWSLVRVLTQAGDARALPALADLATTEEHPVLRLEVLQAIAAQPEPEAALEVLRQTLHEGEPRQQWNAAVGLAVLGLADGLELLHRGVQSSDPLVRWQALEALARVHDERTVGVIAPLLRSAQAEERAELMFTLGRIGGPEAYLLLAVSLKDPAPEVRWRACFALGKLGNVRAILPLRQLLTREKDPKVIERAEQALTLLEAAL